MIVLYGPTDPDFFSIDAHVQVNTVNCKGVMGKGIAAEFKNRHIRMFVNYVTECTAGRKPKPGDLILAYEEYFGQLLILNVATKDHWRDPSQYPWIALCLEKIKHALLNFDPSDDLVVCIPPLGCGNGGLDWAIVKPMMYEALDIPPFENFTICIWEPR